jgi:hypothetical protein
MCVGAPRAAALLPLLTHACGCLCADAQILDMTSLYLNNCVLGISLFNFGLFAYTHGIISCGYRRAAEVVFLRSVVSPICCLCVMLMFGLRGEPLKIMTMQGALPQAVSSFVVFKEFKIQPDVFSTSTTVGTALCLPVMIIWCVPCVLLTWQRRVLTCVLLTWQRDAQVLPAVLAVLSEEAGAAEGERACRRSAALTVACMIAIARRSTTRRCWAACHARCSCLTCVAKRIILVAGLAS